MMKYVIGVIIVLLVIIGGYFAYKGSAQAPAEPTVDEQVPTTSTYASSTMGVSVSYPNGYSVDENYVYTQANPKKPIHGVQFIIPGDMATGTNLSSDTYISIEQLPRAKNCTGDIYLAANTKPEIVNDGAEYSLATTTGAAAGNIYEEHVYALVGTKPCTAVRYYIHSSNIGNYEPGAVREFDRQALLSAFDAIRRSLTLGSAPAATTTDSTPTP